MGLHGSTFFALGREIVQCLINQGSCLWKAYRARVLSTFHMPKKGLTGPGIGEHRWREFLGEKNGGGANLTTNQWNWQGYLSHGGPCQLGCAFVWFYCVVWTTLLCQSLLCKFHLPSLPITCWHPCRNMSSLGASRSRSNHSSCLFPFTSTGGVVKCFFLPSFLVLHCDVSLLVA